jgi:hypothetical protein
MKIHIVSLIIIWLFNGYGCSKDNGDKSNQTDSTSVFEQTKYENNGFITYTDSLFNISFQCPKEMKFKKVDGPSASIIADSVLLFSFGGGAEALIYKTNKDNESIYIDCEFEKVSKDSNGYLSDELESDLIQYPDTVWTYADRQVANAISKREWVGLEGTYSPITHYSEAYQQQTGLSGSAGIGEGLKIVMIRKFNDNFKIVAIYTYSPQNTMTEEEEAQDPQLFYNSTFDNILESINIYK